MVSAGFRVLSAGFGVLSAPLCWKKWVRKKKTKVNIARGGSPSCALNHANDRQIRDEVLEMGCRASAKRQPLVCPLVGFEGVCLCRLCSLKIHWHKGFALQGALRGPLQGALRGALRGTLGIFISPDSNFLGLLSYRAHATIIFNGTFAKTPMKNRLTFLQAFC